MNEAKQAVKGFLSRDGKHDTTVHETVNPAVTKEVIKPHEHEDIQTATERVVDQHHHHTSVQPVQDKQILPEKHTHEVLPTEHRHVNHGDDSHVKERLAAESAQFKDTRQVYDTQHSQSVAPGVTGEHVHHHVHENIQPVINREVVQPHVVHKTVPVTEYHTNESKHHTATALPAMSIDQFKQSGGSLSGREERVDRFDGQPKALGSALGHDHGHDRGHGHTGTGVDSGAGTGAGVGGVRSGTTHGHDSHTGTGIGSGVGSGAGVGGVRSGTTHGHDSHTGTGIGSGVGSGVGVGGVRSGTNHGHDQHHVGRDETEYGKKPSMMDKLNPMKDSDGDGKKGFMK